MRTVPLRNALKPTRWSTLRFASATCAAAVLAMTPGTATSQPTNSVLPLSGDTPVPMAIEGAINAIDLGAATIVVSQVPVHFDANTKIQSPTGPITSASLLGASLPGRRTPGFTGGRASVIGWHQFGIARATSIYVEPSEDLLIGPAAVTNGQLSILGRTVVLNTDPRMLGRAINEAGFAIDPTTTMYGTQADATGYDSGAIFYASEYVSNWAQLAPANQTLVTRAQCAPGGNLDIRGLSTSQEGQVMVFDDDTNALVGVADVDPGDGMAGAFRLDINHTQTCPSRVRVVNSNGSMVTALVSP